MTLLRRIRYLREILDGQREPEGIWELRLTAYRIARTVTPVRVVFLSAMLTTPLIMILYKTPDGWPFSEETMMNLIVLISFIAAIAIVLVEVFAKGLASQITIKHAAILEDMASSGHSEAAFCLSELHAKREADAYEFIWLERAAKMGHRKAEELLRKRK